MPLQLKPSQVDVEGFEIDALFSAEQTLRRHGPRHIIAEVGREWFWKRAGRTPEDARRLLEMVHENGYEVRSLRMLSQPSTKFITPGSRDYHIGYNRWPRGSREGVNFTLVRPEHFAEYIDLLRRADFNLWLTLHKRSTVR